MQKRQRNKIYYKIGKDKKFFMNEIVMMKDQTTSSLLQYPHVKVSGP
jgi:hypothetical protein